MSNPMGPSETDIIPVDQQIGDDADQAGIAQPVTEDEVSDILNNAGMSIEERQQRLEALRQRLGDRENVDRGGDMEPLEQSIVEALSMLAEGGHTYSTLEGTGMDPTDRADARSPDDDQNLGRPDADGGIIPR